MDLDYNLNPGLRVRVTSRLTRSNFKHAHSLQPSFTLHRPLPVLLQTFKICQYLPSTAQLPFACRIDRCFVVPACPSQSADHGTSLDSVFIGVSVDSAETPLPYYGPTQ